MVARGDRDPEDLGKVAYLVETDSSLSIGLRGRYQDEPFELTGRAQFSHEAGGVWNEWYAAFSNDRWGWLAEAQGRFYLTFQQHVPSPEVVEPFATLTLGALVFASRVVGRIGGIVKIEGEVLADGIRVAIACDSQSRIDRLLGVLTARGVDVRPVRRPPQPATPWAAPRERASRLARANVRGHR